MIAATAFAGALAGQRSVLVRSDGAVAPLHVHRWRAAAGGEDTWLLGRCRGATIDLGCGPGRLVEALIRRGVEALGVDAAAEAIGQCRRRGVPALQSDVFAPLPGEGSWAHVLLVDGNLGIGGDPAALLSRAAGLLGPAGSVLVELDAEEDGLWRGSARVRSRRAVGRPFPWATAGVGALPTLAAGAGLRPTVVYRGERAFAELVPVDDAAGESTKERAAPARGGGTSADATRDSRNSVSRVPVDRRHHLVRDHVNGRSPRAG